MRLNRPVLARGLQTLALAGLLLGLAGPGIVPVALAQGQMRETLGPGSHGRPAPAPGRSDEQDSDEQQAETDTGSGDDAAPGSQSQVGRTGAGEQSGHQSQRGPGNTLDPSDTIVPSLVRRQQQQYDRLAARWNNRQVPAGFKQGMAAPNARDSGVKHVALEARNVDFYLADGVGYHIRHLKAALEPKEAGAPVNFDDPDQYSIHILSGEVLIRPEDLDALFNHYVLTYEPRSLSSVENRTSDGRLKVTVGARLFGFIPPVGGIPTTLEGPITVTPDNKLVYEPDHVEQLGLPVKPLLAALHLPLSKVTPFDRPGVALDGNRLVMDPETMFPPPQVIVDKIVDARLSDAGLTLKFASDTSDAGYIDPPHAADSYIWLQSGDARFFSTLLVNAHLQLLSDSDEPLAFHLYHYRAQSAAGTIRSDPDGTLVVRVPNEFDIDDRDPQQNAGLSRRTAQ
ncbi:hypothetical protein [Salinisphaera sp. T31B1]|uniref:hypothetical protein n=1 Tax=Salinisphaera sp. T31B1 TaxID=727963 RepID=UPI003342C71E